jgi:iduronate 2-sulfatase
MKVLSPFLFLATSLLLPLPSAEAAPPNILLICVDDLKPTLGSYGDPVAKTPHTDRLAKRGVLFESAYCNQAVCSPSRNSLMTGLRPQTLGIYDLPTHFRKAVPDAVTVAQHFQQHGYRTEALGKIMHKGHGNVEDAPSWTVPHWLPKAPSYTLAASNENRREGRNGPRGTATEKADVPDETYADGLMGREAARRLREAASKPSEPFFLAVGFMKPHLPFVAPKKYWDLYDRAQLPMPVVTEPPAGAPDYAGQFGGELRQYSDMPEKGDLDEAQTRHLIHGYYAATSYMDAQLGLVLDALEQSGLADNTIIVLWGDHGWHLGDHRFWCKHTNYEQAARIPLIIAAPGKAKDAKTTALVETVDLYPTLAELAGLPARAGLDGKSFASVLADPAAKTRDSIIHVYPRNDLLGRAIRTARYRMVEWKKPGGATADAEFELYDYEADPLETQNLASEKPEVLAELQAILASHPEAKPQFKDPASVKSDAQPKAKAKSNAKANAKDRVAAFKKRDKDSDGQLTLEEFLVNQPDPEEAPKRFPSFDANKNGFLSEEEYVKSGKIKK